MVLNRWLLEIFIVLHILIPYSRTKTKSMITLLGYLQNAQVGQNYSFLLPPILVTPIVTMILADRNTVGNNQEKDTEGTIDTSFQTVNNDDIEIETSFRQTLNRGTMETKAVPEKDKLNKVSVKQSVGEQQNQTDIVSSNNNVTLNNEVINANSSETNATEATTLPNNKLATNVSLTIMNESNVTTTNITLFETLPPENDIRWQNFETKNVSEVSNAFQSSTESASTNYLTSTNTGPYSAALYNNALINHLSITTDSYTNEQLPLLSPKDDRWRTYPTLKKTPYNVNGFKPLAGLYYDGFLHKPLVMLPGFRPAKYNYI